MSSYTRTAKRARTRVTARERELMLAREAIELVASGGAPRVVVAGIRFGESIADEVRRLALSAGVRVRPVQRADGIGSDLLMERMP